MLLKLRRDFVMGKLVRKQGIHIHAALWTFRRTFDVITNQKCSRDNNKVIIFFAFWRIHCVWLFPSYLDHYLKLELIQQLKLDVMEKHLGTMFMQTHTNWYTFKPIYMAMFRFLNVSIQNLQIIHFYVFMCGQKQRMHKFVCVYKLHWTHPRVLEIILLWLEVNNINLLNKLSWICSICCYTIVNCSPESISFANSVLPQSQCAIFRARGIKFTIWWISDTMYRTKVSFVWFWKKKSAIINNIIIGRGWAVLVTKENKTFNKWIVKKIWSKWLANYIRTKNCV